MEETRKKTIMEPGKIILLNGPSSSGKTTLALALQKQLDISFIRFSFDLFLDHKAFPREQIKSGKFSWEEMRPAIFRGIHQCLPELERREMQRGDRRPGEASQDFQTVHSIPIYDLQINSENPLEENVTQLIEEWKERRHPSATDKMIEETHAQGTERS
jgi:chloramphenicol 3-O phosphotransferase